MSDKDNQSLGDQLRDGKIQLANEIEMAITNFETEFGVLVSGVLTEIVVEKKETLDPPRSQRIIHINLEL